MKKNQSSPSKVIIIHGKIIRYQMRLLTDQNGRQLSMLIVTNDC